VPAGVVQTERMLRRQDEFLSVIRGGLSLADAVEKCELGNRTLKHWRTVPEFRNKLAHARKAGAHRLTGSFPDFLTWREEHCAYLDERTNRWVRARNSWYQLDAVKHLETNKRLIMVLPPGHIKTTLFCIERSAYDLMRDRNFRVTVIQKNQDEARKLVAAVKLRLSDHEYYHHAAEELTKQGDTPITCPLCEYEDGVPYKGEWRTGEQKWGAESFIVNGRTSGEKDASMEAKGFGSQVQGVRAARIVIDDLQDPEMAVKSQKDSDDKLGWVQRVVLGRITDYQQLVTLANFFTNDDFAHKLIDAEPEWPVVAYPAFLAVDPINGHAYSKPKPLCPEYWTPKGLEQKQREVGDEVWHFTWMQEEGSLETAIFRKEALEAARDEDYVLGRVPPQVTHVFVGCDPAISRYCAIVSWGLDIRTGQRFLVDVFNEKGLRTFQNIQAQVLAHARSYGARVAAIEMNNIQGSISNDPDFVRAMRAIGTKVTTYQTRTELGARAEHDSYDISSIGALFDQGLITLPYGGTNADRDKVDAYIAQFLSWRPGVKYLTRDQVMATLFAESEAYPVAQKGSQPKPKRISQAPQWATNGTGGWSWRKPVRPKRAGLSTVAP
jgi:hypothetical protein